MARYAPPPTPNEKPDQEPVKTPAAAVTPPPFGEKIFRCAVCGRQRGEANQWLVTYTQGDYPNELVIGHLSDYEHDAPGELPKNILALCGRECLLKTVSQFVEGR